MSTSRGFICGALAFGLLSSVSACGPAPADPKRQIGPHPYLPDIHQYLLPPMHVVTNMGWKGSTPKVPGGLQIKALASGLKNPRSLYVLPNGDILVVETDGPPGPVNRPKEFIMNWIEKQAHSSVKAGNRILLLRDNNGDGVPDLQTVFIDHLNSPFGVVLVGNDLYVANTDAIMRFPYQPGETQITTPGTKLCDLPGGPIDHHWTKSLTQPGRQQAVCGCGFQQQHHGERPGGGERTCRDLGDRSQNRRTPPIRHRAAQSQRPDF